MNHPDAEGFGSRLSKNPLVLIIGLIASGIAIIAFLTNKQSMQDFIADDKTAVPQPSPTPDPSNLYTYFPSPNIGITRTYNYSYVFAQPDQNGKVTGQKTENGSYSETVTIVNQDFIGHDITIAGVEIKGNDYLARCESFYWVVYDRTRFYIICSKDYVFNAAGAMIDNPAPDLTAASQDGSDLLHLGPEYFAPFEIGKYWNSNRNVDIYLAQEVSVKGKVSKTISLGTYDNCFQFRFWAVNYEELRYLCPHVGLVAIEVYDHGDYYSAELVSMK